MDFSIVRGLLIALFIWSLLKLIMFIELCKISKVVMHLNSCSMDLSCDTNLAARKRERRKVWARKRECD